MASGLQVLVCCLPQGWHLPVHRQCRGPCSVWSSSLMANEIYHHRILSEVMQALDHVLNSWMQDSLMSREEILSVIQAAANEYLNSENQ